MAMDINGLNSTQTNTNKAKSSQGVPAPKDNPKSEASAPEQKSSATVQISAEAKVLSQVSEKLGTDTPVNREKVEALRAAIADGSYTVDAEKVAQKILDSDRLF